jgi:hypothetical protein
MTMQREMLLEEVETLTGRWTKEISEKIIQTEAHVQNEDIRIEQMIDEPSVDLSYVMRAFAENKEMKAYLRGLKFGVDLSKIHDREKPSKKRSSNRRG